MTSIAAPMPYRLTRRTLLAGHALYALLLVICLGMFAISLYGKAVWGALGDCAALFAGQYEEMCANWRAAVHTVGLTPAAFEAYFFVVRVLAALPCFALSLILVRRHRDELRVLLLAGLLLLLGIAGPIFTPFWQWAVGWYAVDNQIPFIQFLIQLLDFLQSVSFVLFALLFPDGRFVPRWSRWVALAWVLLRFGLCFFPDTPLSVYNWSNPLGVIIATILQVIALGAFFVWRYRFVATTVQKQQIKWVIMGAIPLGLNFALDYSVWDIYPMLTNGDLITAEQHLVLWELGQDTLWYVAQVIFVICIGVAVLRYRLWDIDLIINRTLAYGALTMVIVALYIAVVGGLGAAFHGVSSQVFALVATGIVAISFQSLRERVQRGVNRFMFGQRDEPQAVLARLAQRLQSAVLPEELLSTTVAIIVDALKVPYAAIAFRRGTEEVFQAQQGEDKTPTEAFALIYHNEDVGRLVVGRRSPNEPLSSADRNVLESIARQMGAVVYAVRLQTELQQARERLVIAREEERRRLRRDLHDGLGPALASQQLKLDTALDLFHTHGEDVYTLLSDVRAQSGELIADVRRLVHNLRPPALDELGLVGALRTSILRMNASGNDTVVEFKAADDLPSFPAAVEAAAYRITMEAVTNVIRHAQARHCVVSLAVDTANQLQLKIEDDGVGVPTPVTSGVGLQSMRERAEELGGSFRLEAGSDGGTCVVAQLPLSTERDNP